MTSWDENALVYQDVEPGGDQTPGQTQNILEGLHIPPGLGTLQGIETDIHLGTFFLTYHSDPDKWQKMGGWTDCEIYTVNMPHWDLICVLRSLCYLKITYVKIPIVQN